MKTAISMPDAVFEAAEKLAKRLHLSRSELFTRAVSAYVQEGADDDVTARLDEVYARESSALDPVIEQVQFASLPREHWE